MKININNKIKKMDKLFEKMFNNPFEFLLNSTSNTTEIIKNNMKYHKACIAYHQSIHDMMEAMNDNYKIINGEK